MFRSFITIAAVAGLVAGAAAQQQMPAGSLQKVTNLKYGSYDFQTGFTTTNGGPGYASTNLAYLIYNQALVQFDVGMASAGGLIAVVIANIAAIVLIRMIGKNLTDKP